MLKNISDNKTKYEFTLEGSETNSNLVNILQVIEVIKTNINNLAHLYELHIDKIDVYEVGIEEVKGIVFVSGKNHNDLDKFKELLLKSIGNWSVEWTNISKQINN